MSCACLQSLLNLLKSLLPMVNLKVAIPPVMEQLAMVAGTAAAAPGGASASAQLNAALALRLPALPISLTMVEQIAATANAVAQIGAATGMSPLSPGASARLAVTIQSLNLNLAALLPLASINPAPVMRLSLALSTIASLRASLGVDLLAPRARVALRAALRAQLGIPAPAVNARMMARVDAYARLALAAQAFGGLGNLIPSLRLIANLNLPPLGLLLPLGNLAALLGAVANINSVLGINPLAARASAQIRLALQPLAALEGLTLSATENLGSPALASPTLAADLRMMAGMKLSALAGLRLPNLGPLALALTLMNAGQFGRKSACSSSCPVGRFL